MKTIPVSFLIAGMLLPAVCVAQLPDPPEDSIADQNGERRGPQRPLMDASDTDRDGVISKPEFDAMPRIQKLPQEKSESLFRRLDKNADGRLSREELAPLGKPRDGKDTPMKRLWELDADKSGGISLEEFKAGQLFMKLPPQKQQEVFRRLDTDGDGVISPKDRPVHPFRSPEGKPHPKRGDGERPENGGGPDQINRKLDLNGDGALSFEEFRAGPAVRNLTEDQQEDRFEMLDRNKDHKISPEDIPTEPSPPTPPGN